ncbi:MULTISPECIES: PD-(D/E)XK nuclease family protein [unclassified Bradyrhizobium]|uniref:PD-(D/E)XK nuclease family protein n=1 Tax=unclassified Bradyrhizobium TaxID=2631580 RepID=UPI003396E001
MELPIKPPDRVVPEYSLTGDLLSYRRCAMQYRYYNGSALPPSRPVQMWYGEFIHGVLEGAFGMWRADPGRYPFPWPSTPIPEVGAPAPPPAGLAANDLRVIGWPIEQALAYEGKRARSRRARVSAYRRAEAAVNMLGPHLFPLIADAEQKVIGTRPLPRPVEGTMLRSERYALHGVIDVLTNVELANVGAGNIIREAVRAACPDLQGTFEVIVDYKGSHRPETDKDYWQLGEWQVQTYAWLRQRQQLGYPVAAGILIYVNELAPGSDDIRKMKAAIQNGKTDVAPTRGDPDYYALNTWTGGPAPRLSAAFRYRRAIRIIPVTQQSIDNATTQFDRIVAEIEGRVRDEEIRGSIRNTWPPNCNEPETCIACDFRHFCPNPAGTREQLATAEAAGDDDDV